MSEVEYASFIKATEIISRATMIKTSDTTTLRIVDFIGLVNTHNLNSPPHDLVGAFLRWLLFNPCPSEVWAILPPILLWLKTGGCDYPWMCTEYLTGKDNVPKLGDKYLDRLNELYPPNKGRPGGKVHLGPADIVQACGGYQVKMLAHRLLNGHNDWEQIFATSILILPYASRMSRDLLVPYLLNTPSFFNLSFKDAVKALKVMHTCTRISRTFPNVKDPRKFQFLSIDETRQLYGMDLICGPSVHHKYDPTAEVLMRTMPGSLPITPTLHHLGFSESTRAALFTDACMEVADEVLPREIHHVPTFTEWFDDRMAWTASGGAPGAKIKWGDGTTERVNKRGAMLGIPESHFRHIYDRYQDAVLYSKSAEKYEKGKSRTIQNSGIEHYTGQGYILDIVDSVATSTPVTKDKGIAPASFDSARLHAAQRLAKAQSRLTSMVIRRGFMWDFADFNINHLNADQRLVFISFVKAIAARVKRSKMSEARKRVILSDLTTISRWLDSAKSRTVLDDNISNDPLIAYVVRSLQSGERATAFTNTYHSRAYRKLHSKTAVLLFGRELIQPGDDEQGDDVFATVDSISDGVLASALHNLLGFAGQAYKITLDYSPRGEFLRLCYDGVARQVSGYPIRSTLGLISGEFFADSVFDPAARAGAFYEAVDKCNRRGALIPRGLLQRLVTRNCFAAFTKNGSVTKVTPDLEYVRTPKAFGGLGISGLAYFQVGRATHDGAVKIRTFKNVRDPPIFQPPRVDALKTLKGVVTRDRTAAAKLPGDSNIGEITAKIILESAIQGAYRRSDLSDSIARYAENLHLFQKSLQRTTSEFTLPTYQEWEKRGARCAIHDLLISVFGLAAKPTRQSGSLLGRYAIIIASGDGKTTLKKKYPDLFCDHDDYVDKEFIQECADNEDWGRANNHNFSRNIPLGRILLTWAHVTVPLGYTVLGMPMLREGSGLRQNVGNRAHNIATAHPGEITWCDTFAERDSIIFNWVDQVKSSLSLYERLSVPIYSESKTPTHSYNILPGLVKPMGFSLLEVMSRACERSGHLHYPGRLGQWYALYGRRDPKSDTTMSLDDGRRFASADHFFQFAMYGGTTQLDLRLKYLEGSLSFLPPQSNNHSSDVLVTIRDITLHLLESKYTWSFSLPEQQFILTVHSLENYVTYYYERVFMPHYCQSIRILD